MDYGYPRPSARITTYSPEDEARMRKKLAQPEAVPGNRPRTERDLLDRAYMLVGHALPAALQTEIKAALGITPPVVSDDVRNLIEMARGVVWMSICGDSWNFDNYLGRVRHYVDKTGITTTEQANAWFRKMEAALSVDVGAIEAERDKAKADLHFYACKVDDLTVDRDALRARIDGGTRVTSELAALRKLFERIDEETHPDNKCLPSGAASYEFAENADRTVAHLRRIAQEGIRNVENLEFELAEAEVASTAQPTESFHVEGTCDADTWDVFETASYDRKCQVYGDHLFALRVAQMLSARTENEYIMSLEADVADAKADRNMVREERDALRALIDAGIRVRAYRGPGPNTTDQICASESPSVKNATLILDEGTTL